MTNWNNTKRSASRNGCDASERGTAGLVSRCNQRQLERRGTAGERCDNLFARRIVAPRREIFAPSKGSARMATRKAGKRIGRTTAARPAPDRLARAPLQPNEAPLVGVAQQVRAWADSVLGIAGAAADVSIGAARAILVKPEQRAALAKAGVVLRGMREAAGLSLREVGEAINLKDPSLLELVENGKVALPFEIILRLASVLGRNDPISFVMRFTRSYNPEVWHTLEGIGVGRFALQAGREREFANIYRGSDAARRLSDEDFAAALSFMKAAFELALTFHRGKAALPAPPARRGGRRATRT